VDSDLTEAGDNLEKKPAPGLSLTARRDLRTGQVLWLSTDHQFRGHWAEGQWPPAEPPPYSTATPYPTFTLHLPCYRGRCDGPDADE
jgi:hypothetical protein